MDTRADGSVAQTELEPPEGRMGVAKTKCW